MARLEACIEVITDKPPVIPEELKLRTGELLLLEEDGHPRFDTGYDAEPFNEPQEPPPHLAGPTPAPTKESMAMVAEPPTKQA